MFSFVRCFELTVMIGSGILAIGAAHTHLLFLIPFGVLLVMVFICQQMRWKHLDRD